MNAILLKGIHDKADQYKLKKFLKKIDYSTYLEKSKDVCSGEFVFKNTRITPKNVWNYIA